MTVYFGGDDDDFRTGAGYNPAGSYNYPSYDTIAPPPTPAAEPGSYLVNPYLQAEPAATGGGFLDSLLGGLKSVASTITGVAAMTGKAQPVYQQQQPPLAPVGPPSWLIPVAVVGGGVILLVVLKRMKRPAMAGYRRRSRRSRR